MQVTSIFVLFSGMHIWWVVALTPPSNLINGARLTLSVVLSCDLFDIGFDDVTAFVRALICVFFVLACASVGRCSCITLVDYAVRGTVVGSPWPFQGRACFVADPSRRN